MLLAKGSQGQLVLTLKANLLSHGYDLDSDDMFDQQTDDAVRDFQRENNLSADGIVGPMTWMALNKDFLINNYSLKRTPLKPVKEYKNDGSAMNDVYYRIANSWGGLCHELSRVIDIPLPSIYAVMAVESGGVSHTEMGMVIRFENHVFARQPQVSKSWFDEHFRYSPRKVWQEHFYRQQPTEPWIQLHISEGFTAEEKLNNSQYREWDAFNLARKHSTYAAMSSISMGLPQIMGFNYKLLGYNSVSDMFTAFNDSAHAQILGMFDFIRSAKPNNQLLEALKREDFESFAAGYNGPGQAEHYAGLIRRARSRVIELNIT